MSCKLLSTAGVRNLCFKWRNHICVFQTSLISNGHCRIWGRIFNICLPAFVMFQLVLPSGHTFFIGDGGSLHCCCGDPLNTCSGTKTQKMLAYETCFKCENNKKPEVFYFFLLSSLSIMAPLLVAWVNAFMTCVHLADSGVGDSHAFYREQEFNPPRPRLPDPPAGVVRLWLPALVSSLANTVFTQFIDQS